MGRTPSYNRVAKRRRKAARRAFRKYKDKVCFNKRNRFWVYSGLGPVTVLCDCEAGCEFCRALEDEFC